MMVLSHFQATPLLAVRASGARQVSTSPDLGITSTLADLNAKGIRFPTGERIVWSDLEIIAASETACFALASDTEMSISPIRTFSETTGRVYALMPTTAAPTMLVSGIPMHRIKGTDPTRDTAAKIQAVAPVHGRVLDTTTGLGYTAIAAAKTASAVVTVELDPAAQTIARANPWSKDLFDNPRIELLIGDSFDVIQDFPPGSFDCILHDPPTFSLAGELYSTAFYRQAHRVLSPRGRMFHYIGDPASPSGARVTRGVVRRLREAGFSRVVPRPEAFGVVAYR